MSAREAVRLLRGSTPAVGAAATNPTVWQVAQAISDPAVAQAETDPEGGLRVPRVALVDRVGATERRGREIAVPTGAAPT